MTTDRDARNRAETEQRIVSAARALLVDSGPGVLGVNAVARAAGCDKQLVYRYFGGLEGVLSALGEALAADLVARLTDAVRPADGSYAAFLRAMLAALVAAYRADPALLRMKLAEWGGGPDLTALTAARGAALSDWVRRHRPNPPDGAPDPAASNALLIGAVEAMVLSGLSTGSAYGLDLGTDAGWERVARAVDDVVDRLYDATPDQPSGPRPGA